MQYFVNSGADEVILNNAVQEFSEENGVDCTNIETVLFNLTYTQFKGDLSNGKWLDAAKVTSLKLKDGSEVK
jgi:hypothetical protein